jgi:hypothetical protein
METTVTISDLNAGTYVCTTATAVTSIKYIVVDDVTHLN